MSVRLNFTRIETSVWEEKNLPSKMRFSVQRKLFSCFPGPKIEVSGGKTSLSLQVLECKHSWYGVQEWDTHRQKGLDLSKTHQDDVLRVQLLVGKELLTECMVDVGDIL